MCHDKCHRLCGKSKHILDWAQPIFNMCIYINCYGGYALKNLWSFTSLAIYTRRYGRSPWYAFYSLPVRENRTLSRLCGRRDYLNISQLASHLTVWNCVSHSIFSGVNELCMAATHRNTNKKALWYIAFIIVCYLILSVHGYDSDVWETNKKIVFWLLCHVVYRCRHDYLI